MGDHWLDDRRAILNRREPSGARPTGPVSTSRRSRVGLSVRFWREEDLLLTAREDLNRKVPRLEVAFTCPSALALERLAAHQEVEHHLGDHVFCPTSLLFRGLTRGKRTRLELFLAGVAELDHRSGDLIRIAHAGPIDALPKGRKESVQRVTEARNQSIE